MRIPSATWFSAAAIILAAGILQNSADLMAVGAGVGVVGLVARLFVTKRELPSGGAASSAELEQRLRSAEDALISASNELSKIKADREFDAQLKQNNLP